MMAQKQTIDEHGKTGDVSMKQRDEEDTSLVNKAIGGDIQAFSDIVRCYQSSVYNLCCRYLGSQDGEDAAQETFIKAFVHRERFKPDRPLRPWLLTVARHLCLDRLRKKKTVSLKESDEETLSSPEPDGESAYASKQTLLALQTGMSALPAGQREVVALFHIEGLSYREISEILEIPQGTVMTWLHRGRNALKAIVQGTPENKRAIHGGE